MGCFKAALPAERSTAAAVLPMTQRVLDLPEVGRRVRMGVFGSHRSEVRTYAQNATTGRHLECNRMGHVAYARKL